MSAMWRRSHGRTTKHRQTKGAETDMSDLQQPRHISTLPILLQNDFWCWNEEQFSRPRIESGILIHRTDDSDSIVAEFPWPGRSSGTFATKLARLGRADRPPG